MNTFNPNSKNGTEEMITIPKKKWIASQQAGIENHKRVQELEKLLAGYESRGETAPPDLVDLIEKVKLEAQQSVHSEIANTRAELNKLKFDNAVKDVFTILPELNEYRDEFVQKLNNMGLQNNDVPDNIVDILKELGKSFLFDKIKTQGQEPSSPSPLNISGGGGDGSKNVSLHHSIEEWNEMRIKNPKLFASKLKEFEEDEKKNFGL